MNLTAASLALFLEIAEKATVGDDELTVTTATRGNLTQLKKAGLLMTFIAPAVNSHGTVLGVSVTEAGAKLATQHGIELYDWA